MKNKYITSSAFNEPLCGKIEITNYGKENNMIPCKGAIAFCSVGRLGLITSETPEEMTFFNGDKAMVWKGIQLTDGMGGKNKDFPQKAGDFWCSKNPVVVGHVKDFIK